MCEGGGCDFTFTTNKEYIITFSLLKEQLNIAHATDDLLDYNNFMNKTGAPSSRNVFTIRIYVHAFMNI